MISRGASPPQRASCSITWRTSSSGAEAPAVRPTARLPANHSTLQVRRPVDQVAGHAGTVGQLAQAVGVGAGARAHHQQHVALLQQLLDRILAVLRGIADVLAPRRRQLREAPAQRRDDFRGVIDRERRLGDERQALRVAHLQLRHVGGALHQVDAPARRRIEASHGAFDLRVPRVADEDDVAAFARVALHFHVHLGHQRAGGVEYRQPAQPRLLLDGIRHAVRGEDHRCARGNLAELFDENRAEAAQPLHHVVVVHHLVAHVDGRPEQLERTLDDVDRAVDTGAETAGIGEQHLHQTRDLRVARASRQASSNSTPAPMVMAESATLNAGK